MWYLNAIDVSIDKEYVILKNSTMISWKRKIFDQMCFLVLYFALLGGRAFALGKNEELKNVSFSR